MYCHAMPGQAMCKQTSMCDNGTISSYDCLLRSGLLRSFLDFVSNPKPQALNSQKLVSCTRKDRRPRLPKPQTRPYLNSRHRPPGYCGWAALQPLDLHAAERSTARISTVAPTSNPPPEQVLPLAPAPPASCPCPVPTPALSSLPPAPCPACCINTVEEIAKTLERV